MTTKLTLFASTICMLICLSEAAFSCDVSALRANVEWLRTNNAGAFSAIRTQCNRLGDADQLQALIDAYKDGQRHNPSAQAAIDGCTVAQIGTGAC